jgi:putative Ca2+/H+ antiporter (TMEM165/GDT1 family)
MSTFRRGVPMNKAIFSCALGCVLFLIAGTYLFPNNPVMWLAGTTLPYTIFRALAAVALITVLVTNPPRKLYMRIFMGFASVVLLLAGLGVGASDSVQILDMMLYLILGVSLGIEALEFNEEELEASALTLRQEYVRQSPTPIVIHYQADHTAALAAHDT